MEIFVSFLNRLWAGVCAFLVNLLLFAEIAGVVAGVLVLVIGCWYISFKEEEAVRRAF